MFVSRTLWRRNRKAQLILEHHGGPTARGVAVRNPQRLLALVAAIRHDDRAGQPVLGSLSADDRRCI